jgi:short-subunit dehydrogenase
MGKVVIITGASAGIGKTTAELYKSKGYIVYNLARREAEGLNNIKTDVSRREDIQAAFKQIYDKEGSIDIVVNNAGMGISGAIESTTPEAAHKLMDINFYGALYVMQEAVPYMRKSGGGTIINTSSAAAKLPIPFQAFYSASKAALSSLSDALRIEVAPMNIKVTAILPGDVKTEFTEKREKNKSNDPVYGERIDRSVAVMERDEQNGMSPMVIAKQIVKLSESKNPPPYVVGGKKYALLVWLAKILPYRFVVYVMGKIYG